MIMSFLMAPRWDMICCIITSWKHHKITVISITESPITHSGLSRLTREKSETSALLITSGNPLTMAHHYHRHHHGDQGAVHTACPIGWCRQHQAMSLTGSLCLCLAGRCQTMLKLKPKKLPLLQWFKDQLKCNGKKILKTLSVLL